MFTQRIRPSWRKLITLVTVPALALSLTTGCIIVREVDRSAESEETTSPEEDPSTAATNTSIDAVSNKELKELFSDGRLTDCALPMKVYIEAGANANSGRTDLVQSETADHFEDGKVCTFTIPVEAAKPADALITMRISKSVSDLAEEKNVETDELGDNLTGWTAYTMGDESDREDIMCTLEGAEGTPLEGTNLAGLVPCELLEPFANDLSALAHHAADQGIIDDAVDLGEATYGDKYEEVRNGEFVFDGKFLDEYTTALEDTKASDDTVEIELTDGDHRVELSDPHMLDENSMRQGSDYGRLCFDVAYSGGGRKNAPHATGNLLVQSPLGTVTTVTPTSEVSVGSDKITRSFCTTMPVFLNTESIIYMVEGDKSADAATVDDFENARPLWRIGTSMRNSELSIDEASNV